jgi:hypothetical protein
MLISKIILKKIKNIILMHFSAKKTLKNNRYYILKHPLVRKGKSMHACLYFLGQEQVDQEA